MESKKRAESAAALTPEEEAGFRDAVVLVREPFVVDRALALQAIRYTKEMFPGAFSPNESLSAAVAEHAPSSSSRRRTGTNR